MAELLAVEGVTAGYGDGIVPEDVSLALDEGDSLALLGRNGMGKTTLLVTLMGLTRVRGGTMRWRGKDLAALPKDVTILFIEHDMGLVFRFAERITVLVGGRVLTEGAPAEIAADPRVREVYLGEAQHG